MLIYALLAWTFKYIHSIQSSVSISVGRDRMMDQESSLTLTVGLILGVYLVCNVPANLILLLDSGSVAISQSELSIASN